MIKIPEKLKSQLIDLLNQYCESPFIIKINNDEIKIDGNKLNKKSMIVMQSKFILYEDNDKYNVEYKNNSVFAFIKELTKEEFNNLHIKGNTAWCNSKKHYYWKTPREEYITTGNIDVVKEVVLNQLRKENYFVIQKKHN